LGGMEFVLKFLKWHSDPVPELRRCSARVWISWNPQLSLVGLKSQEG